jgi:two-component system cell cycle sensor histidine kinase/response regulator CckA
MIHLSPWQAALVFTFILALAGALIWKLFSSQQHGSTENGLSQREGELLKSQQALQSQLAQSQKMQAVGLLAGGIAHDFNNLLTAISGFCDLLLLRHRAGDPSFADIMQIQQNANRGANLVRQLLAFSRQQTLQPKAHDLTDVLSDVSHLLRRLIGENIKLELQHGRDLGLIFIDLGQMEQVLVNLVVNARDAMPTGGTLTLKTFAEHVVVARPIGNELMQPGEWMGILVSDTGTGMPPDVLVRIFDPFFTTKEVGKGTGLGLSTAIGIINQSGGHLDVASEEGKGTHFTIYLPRYVGVATAKEDPTPQVQDTTGSGTILLVEDEDAVRNFAARALKHKGYDVLEADSGITGLEVFRNADKKITLMISDVVMPEMDGPTLYAEICKTRSDLKVIFVSGYTEERLKPLLGDTQNPNVYFLTKPFSLAQLTGLVKEILG